MQFVVSLVQYFSIFAALGIPVYGIREVAKHKQDPKELSVVFTELTVIYFISSMLIAGIYLAIIYFFPFFNADRRLFLGGGLLILLSFSFTDWFYSGLEEFKGITIRSIIIKLISLLFLYLVVKHPDDYYYYLFIVLFSILGNQILGFGMVFKKTRFNFSAVNLKRHLNPLFYLFSGTIAASIYSYLDTVLLGLLSTEESVGLYTASVKLVKISIPIINSMGILMIPVLSNSFANNHTDKIREQLGNSFNFLVFLSIPVCVGFILLAPECLLIFSGKAFLSATLSMQVLALLPVLIGFGHLFCFQILMPAGKNKEIFLSTVLGVFVCLILNFILVPILNELGASIANVVTELTVTATYFYFISKHFSFSYNWRFLNQCIISSLVFIPAVLLIRQFSTDALPTLIISVIICGLLYLFIQLVLLKNRFLIGFIKPLKNKFLPDQPSKDE